MDQFFIPTLTHINDTIRAACHSEWVANFVEGYGFKDGDPDKWWVKHYHTPDIVTLATECFEAELPSKDAEYDIVFPCCGLALSETLFVIALKRRGYTIKRVIFMDKFVEHRVGHGTDNYDSLTTYPELCTQVSDKSIVVTFDVSDQILPSYYLHETLGKSQKIMQFRKDKGWISRDEIFTSNGIYRILGAAEHHPDNTIRCDALYHIAVNYGTRPSASCIRRRVSYLSSLAHIVSSSGWR